MLTQLRRRWTRLSTRAKFGLILAALAILACLFFIPLPSPNTIREWVESTGPWAPVVYLAAMVACTQLPFPRTVWTLTAGLLFSPLLGIGLMFLGLALSATLSLFIFHRVGDRWISPKEGDDAQLCAVGVDQTDFLVVDLFIDLMFLSANAATPPEKLKKGRQNTVPNKHAKARRNCLDRADVDLFFANGGEDGRILLSFTCLLYHTKPESQHRRGRKITGKGNKIPLLLCPALI